MARSDGTVYIDTRIDTSGFDSGTKDMEKSMDSSAVKINKILADTERSAKSKAASIAAIYRKQGLTQQEAFKKAWEQIERDSKNGSKYVKKADPIGSAFFTYFDPFLLSRSICSHAFLNASCCVRPCFL